MVHLKQYDCFSVLVNPILRLQYTCNLAILYTPPIKVNERVFSLLYSTLYAICQEYQIQTVCMSVCLSVCISSVFPVIPVR